jgi:hypothetical protein
MLVNFIIIISSFFDVQYQSSILLADASKKQKVSKAARCEMKNLAVQVDDADREFQQNTAKIVDEEVHEELHRPASKVLVIH